MVLLIWISNGWDQIKDDNNQVHVPHLLKASVIVVGRNESAYIGKCLSSLVNQTIPKGNYEIIFVDDHSTDGTGKMVTENFPSVVFLSSPEGMEGKKSAIEFAVGHAKNEILVFTDADCQVGPSWLNIILSSYSKANQVFTTGLVVPEYTSRFLSAFQFIDFAAMMQITANGIFRNKFFIANGANMSIRKSMYNELGGMKTHLDVASGDDMFLIQQLSNMGAGNITFLKALPTLVTTKTESSWDSLLNQRKRWAAKTRHYAGRNITLIQAFVFFIHLLIIANIILVPFTNSSHIIVVLGLILAKGLIDYIFISKSCRYFGNTAPLKYFVPAFVAYFLLIFYSAFTSMFTKKYTWKDRNVR